MNNSDDLTARCMRAAQLLKQTDADYFAPVIRLLLAKEQTARHTNRAPRAAEISRNGKRVRGGKTRGVNWSNPDIDYIFQEFQNPK